MLSSEFVSSPDPPDPFSSKKRAVERPQAITAQLYIQLNFIAAYLINSSCNQLTGAAGMQVSPAGSVGASAAQRSPLETRAPRANSV